MHFQNKTAIFIDGANLYAAARALDLNIDYKKILAWAGEDCRLIRANYYTAISQDENGFSPIQPLADWLSYNGFNIVTKEAKEFIDSTGRNKIKGNMDIEMAVDIMEIADKLDHVIIFSGDGDFKKLVEAVQRRGVRVSIVSTIRSNPPMCADELRRQADAFIDLDKIRASIQKDGGQNG